MSLKGVNEYLGCLSKWNIIITSLGYDKDYNKNTNKLLN